MRNLAEDCKILERQEGLPSSFQRAPFTLPNKTVRCRED